MNAGLDTRLFTRAVEGMVANFYAADRIAQKDFRVAIREHALDVVELTKSYTHVITGRMKDSVFATFSPSGLVSEQGWFADDFIPFGLPFYPPYEELGTRFRPAHPALYPATVELQPAFLDRMYEITAQSTLRGFGRGRAR